MVLLFILLFSLNCWGNQSRHFVIDFSSDSLSIPHEKALGIINNVANVITTNGEHQTLVDKIAEFNQQTSKELNSKDPIIKLDHKSGLELYDGYEGIAKYHTIIEIDIHSNPFVDKGVLGFWDSLPEAIISNLVRSFKEIPLILKFLDYGKYYSINNLLITKVMQELNAPLKVTLHTSNEKSLFDFNITTIFRDNNLLRNDLDNFKQFISIDLLDFTLSSECWLKLGCIFKKTSTPFAINIVNSKIENLELEYLIKAMTSNEKLHKLKIQGSEEFIKSLNLDANKLSKIQWQNDESLKTPSEGSVTDTLDTLDSDEELLLDLDDELYKQGNPLFYERYTALSYHNNFDKSLVINLSYSIITDKNDEGIPNLVGKSPTVGNVIEFITAYISACTKNNKIIEQVEICLEHNIIMDEGFIEIVNYLKVLHIPFKLNISNNDITITGIEHLLHTFRDSDYLKELIANNNPGTQGNGIEYLAKKLNLSSTDLAKINYK